MARPRRPNRDEIAAAASRTLTDLIAPGLTVLFCGINPGLYSAAIGHHFGRPGNRFWPTLHRAGFTERLLGPSEERLLLPLGYGITNVVGRASARADELTPEEIYEGGQRLRNKVLKYQPKFLAILGIGVYRTAFGKPTAEVGLQPDTIGDTRIWLLPSPSGLNAHYNQTLVEHYAELRAAAADYLASTGNT